VNISGTFENHPPEGLARDLPPIAAILNGGAAVHTIEVDSLPGIFGFNSRDRRSRSFNLLRTQVMKIMKARDWKIIGITSATPRVGKTFMATNLAASLARIPGTRTLLFDLDLRRGSVAESFGIPPGPGINAFLAGEIDTLEAAAYKVPQTGLTIYPSTPTSASSAELLAGERMRALVEAMRALNENVLCLCDLPPAFANDDASIVLQVIDAYLLVVEEGVTTARQVRDAFEILKPAPCIGTVLNRYNGGLGGGDYGFGYGGQSHYDAYYI
jgi:Mrp family chromosome partitioning ATPase